MSERKVIPHTRDCSSHWDGACDCAPKDREELEQQVEVLRESNKRWQAAALTDVYGFELPLEQALASLLNRHSLENGSNTPDFLLARYLLRCLRVWNETTREREEWYGTSLSPGGGPVTVAEPGGGWITTHLPDDT